MKTRVIALAGGSCSGKTTLANKILQRLGEGQCQILFQDNFYIDQSDKFDHDGGAVNFDHPDALEFSLMAEVIQKLRAGQNAQVPIYDFASHTRRSETIAFVPKPLLLVDGTLILAAPELSQVFDRKYFISCDESDRLVRRIDRDVKERGRTEDGVKAQFSKQVQPMHKQFVEPSKAQAEVVVEQSQLVDEAWFLNLIKTLQSEP